MDPEVNLATDDPWMLTSQDLGQTGSLATVPALLIDSIEHLKPLDRQVGALQKKTVPDALRDALFGQAEPTEVEIALANGCASDVPKMNCYAILDAAKITNLPELLEKSGLEHLCLFNGSAYENLGNVAPWIVRLRSDNSFTRSLFTRSDCDWHLWDKEPGIYIRSRGTLKDMWRHFRRFTRIRDESGNWLYFRFWEPAVADIHFDYLSSRTSDALTWFQTRNRPRVHSVLVLRAGGTGTAIHCSTEPSEEPVGVFVLRREEVRRLTEARLIESKNDISRRLIRTGLGKKPGLVRDTVEAMISRFSPLGYRSKASIFVLAWWELHSGPNFEAKLSARDQAAVRNVDRDEFLRIRDLHDAMKAMNSR